MNIAFSENHCYKREKIHHFKGVARLLSRFFLAGQEFYSTFFRRLLRPCLSLTLPLEWLELWLLESLVVTA